MGRTWICNSQRQIWKCHLRCNGRWILQLFKNGNGGDGELNGGSTVAASSILGNSMSSSATVDAQTPPRNGVHVNGQRSLTSYAQPTSSPLLSSMQAQRSPRPLMASTAGMPSSSLQQQQQQQAYSKRLLILISPPSKSRLPFSSPLYTYIPAILHYIEYNCLIQCYKWITGKLQIQDLGRHTKGDGSGSDSVETWISKIQANEQNPCIPSRHLGWVGSMTTKNHLRN